MINCRRAKTPATTEIERSETTAGALANVDHWRALRSGRFTLCEGCGAGPVPLHVALHVALHLAIIDIVQITRFRTIQDDSAAFHPVPFRLIMFISFSFYMSFDPTIWVFHKITPWQTHGFPLERVNTIEPQCVLQKEFWVFGARSQHLIVVRASISSGMVRERYESRNHTVGRKL